MKILGLSLCLLFLVPGILRGETSQLTETPTVTRDETLRPEPWLAEQPYGWVALPPSRPFPSLLSDPRDIRMGLRKNNKGELEADVGGYRSLAGWKGEVAGKNTVFHTGLEGNAYFVMRQEGSRFPLHSSDGLIGLYAEAARAGWQFQARFTHISAHLSDGLTALRPRIEYTREFVSLRIARQWAIWRAYAGYHGLVHTIPELPRHSLQLGGYGIIPWSWGIAHPYLGADLRIRSEKEGTTFQLGAGAALVSATQAAPVLLTVNYLKGHDLRGQFYNEKTEKWIFGLDLTI